MAPPFVPAVLLRKLPIILSIDIVLFNTYNAPPALVAELPIKLLLSVAMLPAFLPIIIAPPLIAAILPIKSPVIAPISPPSCHIAPPLSVSAILPIKSPVILPNAFLAYIAPPFLYARFAMKLPVIFPIVPVPPLPIAPPFSAVAVLYIKSPII